MCREALSRVSFEPDTPTSENSARSIECVDTIEAVVLRMRALKMRTPRVALVIIALRYDQDSKGQTGHVTPADQSARHYLENLRPLVRKTDSVFLLHHSFYFLLPAADANGGAIVQERLWEALLWSVHNTLENDFPRPRAMTIGHSASVAPDDDIVRCIKEAGEAQLSFNLLLEKPTRKAPPAKDSDLSLLARQLGVPYVPLLPRKLPIRLQRLVTPTLAQELHCFPIGRDRDILTVAMSNPQDNSALERLRMETGLNIFPVLVNPRELQSALEHFH